MLQSSLSPLNSGFHWALQLNVTRSTEMLPTIFQLDVCVSVHCLCNYNWWPTRCKLFWLIYLFLPNQLYMFRVVFSPIIRSTWLYLQLLILPTDIAAGWCHGWAGTAVPSHPWHQPAAIPVGNIRSCKYSQVLLIMGEYITRNMYSGFGLNKYAKIVASCWSSSTIILGSMTPLHPSS